MKDDGYPEYTQPDNGCTIQKVVNNNAEVYTNEQVVSHSWELIVEFDSHINLKVCPSIKSIKYVHKYIYKGVTDRFSFSYLICDYILSHHT